MQLEMNLNADNGLQIVGSMGRRGRDPRDFWAWPWERQGTHVLEGRLDADALDTLETAVRFQMYHAIALVAVGGLGSVWQEPRGHDNVWSADSSAVIVFCGSLYLIALADISAFGASRTGRRPQPYGGLGNVWPSVRY